MYSTITEKELSSSEYCCQVCEHYNQVLWLKLLVTKTMDKTKKREGIIGWSTMGFILNPDSSQTIWMEGKKVGRKQVRQNGHVADKYSQVPPKREILQLLSEHSWSQSSPLWPFSMFLPVQFFPLISQFMLSKFVTLIQNSVLSSTFWGSDLPFSTI